MGYENSFNIRLDDKNLDPMEIQENESRLIGFEPVSYFGQKNMRRIMFRGVHGLGRPKTNSGPAHFKLGLGAQLINGSGLEWYKAQRPAWLYILPLVKYAIAKKKKKIEKPGPARFTKCAEPRYR